MKTRDEMVRTLAKFCDDYHDCNICLLEKFSGGVICDFNRWSDDKLAIAYEHIYKNSEARLDGGHLKESGETPDMVEHPRHYTQGGIEAVCVANVIKYLWRYEKKNGIEDIRKAKFYIERLLKELEESQQS